MSNSNITSVHSNSKLTLRSAKVFIGGTNELEEALNKWFDDNNIQFLGWKCNTWNWLSGFRNKVYARELHKMFGTGGSTKIRFSRKCGCPCGCSPGFNIKAASSLPTKIASKDVWVTIEPPVDAKTISNLIEVANAKFNREKFVPNHV